LIISCTKQIQKRFSKKIQIDGKANLIKHVFIPKPGRSEKRPLGIPTIEDRVKQFIVILALEPQWEAKFEPNS
jgi:RNA-directed DNA polymerase